MIRQFIQITLLTGAMVAGFVPVTLAQGTDNPGSRGVVATVTTIDASTAMATLTTEAGEVFEHPKESQWHVGHKVICDRIERAPRPEVQSCRLWESAHSGAQSPAPRAGRFADTEPPQRAEQPEPRGAEPASRSGVVGWPGSEP